MANKARLEIITNEKGQAKTKKIKYSTTDLETVQIYKSVNKEPKVLLGEVTYGPDTSPPPEPEDQNPVVDAGDDIVVIQGQKVTLDGSAHDDGSIKELNGVVLMDL